MARIGRIAAIGGGLIAVATAATALLAYREKSVEQPVYRRIDGEDDIEVRDYPELLIAETTDAGDRLSALNAGFQRLADYIFAKRRGPGGDATKIAMTAPVLSDRTERGAWRTRFVMPAKFRLKTLPAPDGGVRTATLPARRIAAMRFSGSAGDEALADHERRLRIWLAQRGYSPAGPVEYAFYNSPFVPPPLRHNEVLVPIAG